MGAPYFAVPFAPDSKIAMAKILKTSKQEYTNIAVATYIFFHKVWDALILGFTFIFLEKSSIV